MAGKGWKMKRVPSQEAHKLSRTPLSVDQVLFSFSIFEPPVDENQHCHCS